MAEHGRHVRKRLTLKALLQGRRDQHVPHARAGDLSVPDAIKHFVEGVAEQEDAAILERHLLDAAFGAGLFNAFGIGEQRDLGADAGDGAGCRHQGRRVHVLSVREARRQIAHDETKGKVAGNLIGLIGPGKIVAFSRLGYCLLCRRRPSHLQSPTRVREGSAISGPRED